VKNHILNVLFIYTLQNMQPAVTMMGLTCNYVMIHKNLEKK